MARDRTSLSPELLLPLDRDRPEGLRAQLERGLRDAVREGRLPPDAPLPSTRALAVQLGVSRGIVVEAYEQLAAEGYLLARPGGATRVARTSTGLAVRHADPGRPSFHYDFRPGSPDVDQFPRPAWVRSLRRALEAAPSEHLQYLDGRGVRELRDELATYLDRARGTAADPADMVICTGYAQGLRLVAQAAHAGGARRAAVEDPSDPEYRQLLRAVGLEVVGIPLDAAGLQVELLDAARVDVVVVTAAHQYPTGIVLSPARRTELIAWADRRDGLIVEDDYDAEFRYDRQPVGAIQGLCRDRVVYAGSASKMLAPGVRLGWLLVPHRLAEPIARAKREADMGSSAFDQLAFADFLSRGELDHHLRRMRPIYRARRDALLDALARHLPELTPGGASAGLHLLARLPDDLDEDAVLKAAASAGIGLTGLGGHWLGGHWLGEPPAGGLIFGYGSIAESAIDRGVQRLASALRDQPA